MTPNERHGAIQVRGDEFDVFVQTGDGTCLRVEPDAWREFIAAVKRGEFDRR